MIFELSGKELKMESDKSYVLTVITGESDKVNGRPFYEELVRECRKLGIAGATVNRGIMSYGGVSRIHYAKIERLSEDLPITITIADKGSMIQSIIPFVEANLHGGIAFVQNCDIIISKHGHPSHE
jgi:PII-like signaling protein